MDKNNKKTSKRKIMLAVGIVLILAALGAFGAYEYHYYTLQKFHDVTIELGEDFPDISEFLTENGEPEKARFVTDTAGVDISHAGDVEVTLKQGFKEETVTLSVVDTIAPVVVFVDETTKNIDYELNAEDFVISVDDLSETTVSFVEEPADTDSYEDRELTVVVTDASGNSVSHECKLTYQWIFDEVTLELGEELSANDVLIDQLVGKNLISQDDIDEINEAGVGEYDVVSEAGGKTSVCHVTVQDTTPPELELTEVEVYEVDTASLDDFVVSAWDASGDVSLRFRSALGFGKIGEYTVVIEAEDSYGNVTTGETTLTVKEDDVAPEISGLSDLSVTERSSDKPDLSTGVSSKDHVDGKCSFSYNDKDVDYDTPGTYYVTYTSTDKTGNKATEKRKITVLEDTEAPEFSGLTDISVYVGTAEPDYTSGVAAVDAIDGECDFTYDASSVDIDTVGTYLVKYTAADIRENVEEAVRTVIVMKDDVPPVISLNGSATVYLAKGSTYSEAGASAVDAVDGDLTSAITVSGGVNVDITGTYSLTYSVSDEAGNTASVSRTVYVYEKQLDVEKIDPGDKVIYLTFDDGPGKYTEKLLDILDKYNVKATFFVTNQSSSYQYLIGEEARRGHTVAVHTLTHSYSSIYSSETAFWNDINAMNDIIYAQTGVRATLMRFPGGSSNQVSAQYCTGIMTNLTASAEMMGYIYVDWNVTSGDAGGTISSEQVYSNVISGVQKHNVSVVLQHDIQGFSVNAVEDIIVWGLANGYTFLPLDETSPVCHHSVFN